ncbi:MAG TPA: hypothetical protein VND19_10095 [Acetobacteraceae bacterium]|nr:hypothetical protein [Acetobacteraceae bacterium]
MLALDARVARRPITVTDFPGMGKVGILNPRDRIDGVGGADRRGTDHVGTVVALNDALTTAMRGRAARRDTRRSVVARDRPS